jgi:NADH-quinone oxidoreductase subunit C
MDLEELVGKIRKKLPEAVLGTGRFRDENTLQIRPEDILAVCRFLRDEPGCAFDSLVDLCGADHLPREPRFEVVYHLRSLTTKDLLRLKVPLPGPAPRISSVFSVWKAADWMEREAFDMFGIAFEGHPDLRRILLTPEWEGYPLRKDYPLRGKEETE